MNVNHFSLKSLVIELTERGAIKSRQALSTQTFLNVLPASWRCQRVTLLTFHLMTVLFTATAAGD